LAEIMHDLLPTRCLFCDRPEDRLLYPARLRDESFSAYTFSARRSRVREHYRIVQCNKCSLVRSDPISRENRLNDLYAESCCIYSEEAPYAAETYAILFDRLAKKYAMTVGRVLEIGCGTGFFLEKLPERGISNFVGFEPSKDCVEKASQSCKSRIVNDIFKPELLNGKTFDLACLFHVADHLPDPQETLLSLRDTLNPGGHVLIVCHDVESWTAKLLRDHSPIFDVEHIYLFSQKTIGMLLQSAGFDPIEIGGLSNKYPLGYWMRMLPVVNKTVAFIPEFIKKAPIDIKAGNLYALGKKAG